MNLRAGTLKIVHVNRNSIQHNAKHGDTLPVWRVQVGNETIYCDGFTIDGRMQSVYRPDEPLKCGAKLWLETTDALRLLNVRERTDSEVCKI